jgi:gamma-glutamyltranspeptidase/glutathione hydrolase
MRRGLAILMVGAIVLGIALNGGRTLAASRPVVVGANGMVSSICPMAAEAGIEILKQGGNAFDAYAGISAVLAVTMPGVSSAGGGGWMMMYVKAEDKVVALDHMGRMPYAATPEIFAAMDNPWRDNYKVSLVPGNLGGWYELHRRYGSLPLEQVWARAIDYAENGFPASTAYASSFSAEMMRFPTTAATYFPNRRPPVVGEICYNKDLANTLRMVVKHGIDWLYKGEGAQKIVDHYAKNDGLITAKDLADFSADWWEPISVNYKGYQVYAPPPEASISGLITLESLKILEGYDVKKWGHNSVDYIHHMAEAFKLADADFYQLCIPEERGGGPIPVDFLLSSEHAEAQRTRIDSTRASAIPGSDVYVASGPNTTVAQLLEVGDLAGGTLGVIVADKYGNLIGGIQSAGLGHGTRIVIEGMGFTPTSMIQFADRNADYVWAIKGGAKVPIGVAPVLVMKDGKPWAAMGSGGTETIVQGPVQLILNMVDFGMNPQDAVEAPRFACRGTWADPQGQPGKFELHRFNQMYMEVVSPITFETAMNLANRGHFILPRQSLTSSVGGYSLIVIDPATGTFFGAGDPRRQNYAIGW